MNKTSFYLKYFLASTVIYVATFLFIDHLFYKSNLEYTIAKQHQKLNLKTAYISNFFEPILKDIELLANQTTLQRYLNYSDNKLDLINDYNLFAEVNKSYNQIRVIDENGLESIRINYSQDSVEVVSDAFLQEKKDRDYFLEASTYNKNEIYVSRIELNKEFGAIEIPYRPVLRVSKPLFNKSNDRKGIIITNYDAGIFLEKFAEYHKEEEDFFFLNKDGYFISAPKEYPLWGFMISKIGDKNFNFYFPNVWSQIKSKKNGSFLSNQGLFVFENFGFSDFNLLSIDTKSIITQNRWIMSTWIPQERLDHLLYSYRKNLYLVFFLLLFSTFIGLYFLAKNRLDLITKDQQLTSINKKLKTNQKELVNKNKELEQFVYITSHDLQEPLRTISSYTQILKEDYENKLDKDGKRFLEYLFNSSERLMDLIKGILDYTRIEKLDKKELIKTNLLIEEILQDLQHSIDRTNAEIHVSILPNIIGFPTLIRLLFQNLISNAIKFHRNGVPPKILISGIEFSDSKEFCITDNGIGIKTKHHKKIFNMFQRLHSQKDYEGSGIGLSLCKKIVDLHSGKISIEPNEEIGSTFKISLPD
tara:strand:+ start:23858 stop:25621 length:1764 start_codon:yes stop_codon:yes gene_type:complete